MYSLPKLPYNYNSLEPHIDKETMMTHHKKHHQGYVNKLNKYMDKIKGYQNNLKELQETIESNNFTLRNNGGGHFNHSFFWKCMTNKKINIDKLKKLQIYNEIIKEWKSIKNFELEFKEKALSVFGSGWAWLILKNGKLEITTTHNQDNPLMKKIKYIKKGKPILGLDVWEHAYYLKYKNKRNNYIDAFFNVINWDFLENNFIN